MTASCKHLSDRFHYPALDGSGRQIRLLIFEEGIDDVASFRLDCVALDHHADYLALSYEWSTESPTDTILVDGCDLMIRPNLYSFILHNLRKLHNKQIFIDAICINQRNAIEKQSQIALMGEVYSRAVEVIAWLGSEPPLLTLKLGISTARLWEAYHEDIPESIRRVLRSDLIARLDVSKLRKEEVPQSLKPSLDQMLKDLTDEWHRKFEKLYQKLPPAGLLTTLEASLQCIEATEIIDLDLWRLSFEATFWTRCWVVQELALAPKLTLHLGDLTISGEAYLLLTYVTISEDLIGTQRSEWGLVKPAEHVFDVPHHAIVSTSNDFEKQFGLRRVHNILYLRQHRLSAGLDGTAIPLYEALDKTCKQQCAQRHDHVYPLLGMGRTKVEVDYSTDVFLLYAYVLAESLDCIYEHGRQRGPWHHQPWNVPRACLLAFRFSTRQPAVWIVTSHILQLYLPPRATRAMMHVGLSMCQNALSGGGIINKYRLLEPLLLTYLALVRIPLAILAVLWCFLTHSYHRWRNELMPDPDTGCMVLTYAQWETVASRVYALVQSGQALKWRTVEDV